MAWYEEWFNREYLAVYKHRDLESARRETAFVLARAGLGPEARILDIACGAGRHLQAFARAGYGSVTGVDLSADLLREARHLSAGDAPAPRLVRADMRRLPFHRTFDLATLFFTSFGYFDSDAENASALKAAAGVLCQGGQIFVDYLNPERTLAELEPRSTREVDGIRVEERRRHDAKSRRLIKDIRLVPAGGGAEKRYTESVRLYSRNEMEALLAAAGFRSLRAFGSPDGSAFTKGAPRMLLFARLA